jgi:chromosome segregation ATPase
VRTAAGARDAALARLLNARELAQDLNRLREQIDADAAAIEQNALTLEQLQQAVDEANDTVESIEAELTACDAVIAGLRRREQAERRREALAQVTKRLEQASHIDARLREIRAALAALPEIAERDATELREAMADRDRARARLEGASVSLELTAHQDLDVDGESLASGATRSFRVADDRQIEIDGILTIGVKPGGGEIVRLRDAVRDAERACAALLARLGVDDVDAAEQVVRERRELHGELERRETELGETAPEGIDELARQAEELELSVAASSAEADDAADASESFDPAALEAAESHQQALHRSLQEARAGRDQKIEHLGDARELHAGLVMKLDAARAELARTEERRAGLPDDEALGSAAVTAERNYEEKIAARNEARRQFEAAGGDAVALDVERTANAVRSLSDARVRTSNERVALETRLSAFGDAGCHEAVQELEAELAAAERHLVRLRREAGAARRLYEVLSREYNASRERLTRPVMERIRPYLADLFPGAEVWLDEELGLVGLRTSRADEAFDQLSGGAREQLSLLVRIGLAEVLGTDQSWPLVLDDVLVNTDADRIRRMHRALYQAGRKMQILLFTCHGALFDGLGPDARFELPPIPRRVDAAAVAPLPAARAESMDLDEVVS